MPVKPEAVTARTDAPSNPAIVVRLDIDSAPCWVCATLRGDGRERIAATPAAAKTLGISVQSLAVRSAADFDRAFREATNARAEAVIVVSSRLMTFNRHRVIDFAAKHRLPLASGWGPWASGGGLLSYGPDLDLVVGRAAIYVDKILKGAKPADLPVEQPTRFELIVNLKTARALGLTIPQSLLLSADQVID